MRAFCYQVDVERDHAKIFWNEVASCQFLIAPSGSQSEGANVEVRHATSGIFVLDGVSEG
jgi:hypothetical protein